MTSTTYFPDDSTDTSDTVTDGGNSPKETAHIHSSVLSVGDIVGVKPDPTGDVQLRIVTRLEADFDDVPISIGIGEFGYMYLNRGEVKPGTVSGIMRSSNIVAVDYGPHFDTDFDDYEPAWDLIESDVEKAKASIRNSIDTAVDRYGEDAVEQAAEAVLGR